MRYCIQILKRLGVERNDPEELQSMLILSVCLSLISSASRLPRVYVGEGSLTVVLFSAAEG